MKQKQFWISSPTLPWMKRSGNVLAYLILLVLSFVCFIVYSGVTNMLFSSKKIDIFTKELPQLATYFLPVDRELSRKLTILNEIVQAYLQGENVLQTKEEKINDLRLYITQQKDYLWALGFANYTSLMEFIAQSYTYREEIFLLLWKNQPFNYLILLQNGNEKRPNGGFFGSFAFVKIDGGHIKELEVIDAYLPDYVAPSTRIELPKWFTDTFGEAKAGFIAGNKFWFTDKDGKNIKLLYEKIFNQEFDSARVQKMFDPSKRELLHNQYIKGVIFLDSNLLSDLLPEFKEKSRERQFVNAAIDIIRGGSSSNKKENYIQEVVSYFNTNKRTLLKQIVNHRDPILKKRYLNIYLSNVSPILDTFLQKNFLQTVYQEDTIYSWDINTAFNKSDAFIEKEVQLIGPNHQLLSSTVDNITSLRDLSPWEYRLQIDYDFNVPEYYQKFIRALEKKYAITLTPREEDILVLGPVLHEYKPQPRRRESRGILYFPQYVEITSIGGNITASSQFTTDFSKGLHYRIATNQNHTTLQVIIDFKIYPH